MFTLPQTVTFWEATGNTGSGGKTYAAPVSTAARIANIDKIVFTPQGKERHSTRAIYSTVAIPLGSKVVEGTLTDLTPPTTAQLVISATNNTTVTDMNKALV